MGRAAPGEGAAEVWRLLLELAQARMMRAASGLQNIGLTPGHMKLLLLLDPGEPRPMGALAQSFTCDASTMTWLVDRLEERRLVERRPHPGDRRVKTVALTARGARLRAKAHAQLYEPPPELLALHPDAVEALRFALMGATASRAGARA